MKRKAAPVVATHSSHPTSPQASAQTLAVYNSLAAEYARCHAALTPTTHRHLTRLLDLLPTRERIDVVDVGPAHGIELTYLHKIGGMNLVGIEPALAFHKMAPAGVRYINGDACNLPLPNASQDLVLCHAVLHHISKSESAECNIHRALNELLRILRPGGVLSILTRHGSGHSIEAGRYFQLVTCEDLALHDLPADLIDCDIISYRHAPPDWRNWLRVVLRKKSAL